MARSKGAGRAKRGGKGGQRRGAKRSRAPGDVYEFDGDSDKDLERGGGKYDDVGTYEYQMPEDYDDEEVEESEAFNSDDEALFGGTLAAIQKRRAEKKGSAPGPTDASESEDDDDGAVVPQPDAPGEGDMLLSDLLDGGPAKPMASSRAGGADAVDDIFNDAGAAGADESASGSEADEDDPEALLSALGRLASEKASSTRDRKRRAERGAAGSEAVHNVGSAAAEDEGALGVEDLVGSLDADADATVAKLRKQLARMEKDAAVRAPLPQSTQRRLDREAGYKQASTNVTRFQKQVKSLREAPHVSLSAMQGHSERHHVGLASLSDKFKPANEMEAQVDSLLRSSGMDERSAIAREGKELETNQVSVEEMRRRHAELAKMRALVSYSERKAARMKKIKSKLYRKIKKKKETRKAKKEMEKLKEIDPELARRLEEKEELERREERMSLRHRNTSSWIRRQFKFGGASNERTREAISEQLRRHDELMQRMQHKGSGEGGAKEGLEEETSSSSDEEDEDEEGEEEDVLATGDKGQEPKQLRKLRSRAKRVLAGIEDDEDAAESGKSNRKGLMGLKFMQRSMERQREEAKQEAESLLRELDGGEEGQSEREEAAGAASGRMQFGTGRGAEARAQAERRAAVRRRASERREALGSDADSDAAEQEAEQEAEEVAAADAEGGEGKAGESRRGAPMTRQQRKQAEVEVAGALGSGRGGGTRAAHRAYRTRVDGPVEVAAPAPDGGSGAVSWEVPDSSEPSAAQRRVSTVHEAQLASAAASDGARGGARNVAFARDIRDEGRVAPGGDGSGAGEEQNPWLAPSDQRRGGRSTTGAGETKRRAQKRERAAGGVLDVAARVADVEREAERAREQGAQEEEGGAAAEATQEELIAAAFASTADADEEEFDAEKKAENEAAMPKVEAQLPGWGSWAGMGAEKAETKQEAKARRRKEEQEKQRVAEARKNAPARRDAGMGRVILSEKRDKKAAKLLVKAVPFPYKTREEYERAMRVPLGPQWNTSAGFAGLTRPELTSKTGQNIKPLNLTPAQEREWKEQQQKQKQQGRRWRRGKEGGAQDAPRQKRSRK